MVPEVAVSTARPGQEAALDEACERAAGTSAAMPGSRSHDLQHCIAFPARDLLPVRRDRREDRTVRFGGSPTCGEWPALLHRFSDPCPTVEHDGSVAARTPSTAADSA